MAFPFFQLQPNLTNCTGSKEGRQGWVQGQERCQVFEWGQGEEEEVVQGKSPRKIEQCCDVGKAHPYALRLKTCFLAFSPSGDKLYAEVPKYKVITVAVISDRLKVNGSLARAAIQQLHSEGLIKPVHQHSKCRLFTRATAETTEAK